MLSRAVYVQSISAESRAVYVHVQCVRAVCMLSSAVYVHCAQSTVHVVCLVEPLGEPTHGLLVHDRRLDRVVPRVRVGVRARVRARARARVRARVDRVVPIRRRERAAKKLGSVCPRQGKDRTCE